MIKTLLLVFSLQTDYSVKISAGLTAGQTTVECAGESSQLLFGANPSALGMASDSYTLKQLVAKQTDNNVPTNACIAKNSNCAYDSNYNDYGWEEVKLKTKCLSTEVVSVNYKDMQVTSQKYQNNTTEPITPTASLSKAVQSTSSSTTNSSNTVGVSASVTLEENAVFVDGKETYGMSFNHTWGKSETNSESVTVTSTSSVQFTVDPGKTKTAVLTSRQSEVTIRVGYQVSVSGCVAANWEHQWNGHHFWCIPAESLMDPKTVYENITITNWSEGTTTVNDGSMEIEIISE